MDVRLVFSFMFVSLFARVWADKCERNNCFASNGLMCNNKGTCDCGTCQCEGDFKGPTCEECPACPSVCATYRNCVSCKMFMKGPYPFMDCLEKCDSIMTLIPVSNMGDFDQFATVCEFVNEDNCVEMFSVGGMSDGYRDIYVYTELECKPYVPTTKRTTTTELPTTTEIPTTTPSPTTTTWEMPTSTSEATVPEEEETIEKEVIEIEEDVEIQPADDGYRNKPEDADSVAGSDRFQEEGNGASFSSESLTVTLLISLAGMLLL